MQASQTPDFIRCQMAAAHSIVAITGAGISAASGLPTLATPVASRPLKDLFKLDNAQRHVKEYQKFYDEMMNQWSKAKPNEAHFILAEKKVRIITQNVDGLHHRAGSRSKEVIELHGALRRVRCVLCHYKAVWQMNREFCTVCGGALFPDIVLEGEPVRFFSRALNWITVADLILILGTTLGMYPVNLFPLIALQTKAPVIVINRDAERLLPGYFAKEATSVIPGPM